MGPGRRIAWGLAAGVLLVGLAACTDTATSSDEPEEEVAAGTGEALLGPEDPAAGEPVRIGLVSEGATPAFDNSDELRAGEATAEYLNTHRGGIGGRPIDLVTCEVRSDPARASSCARQMIADGVVAVTTSQLGAAELLWEPLHAAGIPTFFQAGSGQMESDDRSTFLMANPAATFFGVPVAVAEAEGAREVAFVVIDVPQATDLLEASGDEVMGGAGLDYSVERIPIGTADMVPQMQRVLDSGAEVVHVIGNDTFCIAAFQGLRLVAYDGAITAVNQCITDATRLALGDELEGIGVLSTLALGATDDPTYQRYLAVMDAYGSDVRDVDNFVAMGGYAAIASLATALEGIGSEVSTTSVIETIAAMDSAEVPGGGGATFRCGGSADPTRPAVCSNQWLRTVLDAEGEPTTYTVEDSSGIGG